MPELQLILSDKPKRFFCPTRESIPLEYTVPQHIHFPCYIEDFGTYWQVRVDGVVMYLINLDGIVLYKDVFADLKQYGLGIKMLAELDSHSLGSIDSLSFRDLTSKSSDWLALTCGTARFVRFEKLGDYDPYTLGKLDEYPLPGRTR